MKKTIAAIIAAIIAATAVCMTGCSRAIVAEEVEISAAIYSNPAGLDPAVGYQGWGVSRIGVGETLTRFDKDMNTVGLLAESWEVVDDTTWVFHIREGVTFHNGNELTAEAAMNSINRSIETNSRAESISNIESMSADGMDLTIVTKTPYGNLVGYMAEPVFTIVDTSVDMSEYDSKPMCTGAFMVDEFVQDVNIRVVKYDGYWGESANVDAISYPCLSDSSARTTALQTGEINLAQEIQGNDVKILEGDKNFTIYSKPSPKTIFCYMDCENPFLSNIELRKAIAYSMDRELYASQFIGGEPAVGPFSSVLGYKNEELNGYTYDPAKAAEILDEAGLVDTDEDGVREMDGEPIALQVAVVGSNAATYKLCAEAFQAQMKDLGITVDIFVSELIEEDEVEDQYDMMFSEINAGSTNDPQNFLDVCFKTDALYNFGNYSNPELDAMIEGLKTEFDREERVNIAKEASQMILDDCGFVFIAYPIYNIVADSDITGIMHYPNNFYFVDGAIGKN